MTVPITLPVVSRVRSHKFRCWRESIVDLGKKRIARQSKTVRLRSLRCGVFALYLLNCWLNQTENGADSCNDCMVLSTFVIGMVDLENCLGGSLTQGFF